MVFNGYGEADSNGQPVKDVTVLRTEGCYTVILSTDEGADAPAPLCQVTNPEDFAFWDEAYRDVLDLFGEGDLDYAASGGVLPSGG